MPGELFNSVMREVEAERKAKAGPRGPCASKANAAARAPRSHTPPALAAWLPRAGGAGSDLIGGGCRSGMGGAAQAGSSRLALERRVSQRYFNSRPIRSYADGPRPTREAQIVAVQRKAEPADEEDESED